MHRFEREDRLHRVHGHGLNDPGHEAARSFADLVEGVLVFLQAEEFVPANGQQRVHHWTGLDLDALTVAGVEGGLGDPAHAAGGGAGGNLVGVGADTARHSVLEVRLVELGEHRGAVVDLDCVVGHLAGADASQQVGLVLRVDDETAALVAFAEAADGGVGQEVTERRAVLEDATVTVLVAGALNPLVEARLDHVHLQRHEVGTGAKHLANHRRGHHAHQRVERGLARGQEDVGDAFFTEGFAAVGHVHEEVERRRRVAAAVDGGPDPVEWTGEDVPVGVLAETCRRVAHPTQAVVVGHVAVHERGVKHALSGVGTGHNTAVTQPPKDGVPLGPTVLGRLEEHVIVAWQVEILGASNAVRGAHTGFVAGGTEDEGLRGRDRAGRPHVRIHDGLLLHPVRSALEVTLVAETLGLNPAGTKDDVGVDQGRLALPDVAGAGVSTGHVGVHLRHPWSFLGHVAEEVLVVEDVAFRDFHRAGDLLGQVHVGLHGLDAAVLLEVSVRNRSVFPHGHPSVLVHRVGVFPVIAGRRAARHWNPTQHHGGNERLEQAKEDLNKIEGTAFAEAKSENKKRKAHRERHQREGLHGARLGA